MTELEKELTIKVKRLEDDCKAYNFTQHTLQEKIKELEAQIEKMQNCRNCKNEKIEGACGHFTQVGWCKNWELAD